jgi:hypothetical protein
LFGQLAHGLAEPASQLAGDGQLRRILVVAGRLPTIQWFGGLAAALPQAVQGPMYDHPAQQGAPMLDRLLLSDAIDLEEGFLDGIFGIGANAQNPARQPKDDRPVIAYHLVPVGHW